jgi:hypothetical protein
MLHLINNLFTKGWLDVVFDKRNHDYGAYELRNHNSSTTVKALLLSSTFYVFYSWHQALLTGLGIIAL